MGPASAGALWHRATDLLSRRREPTQRAPPALPLRRPLARGPTDADGPSIGTRSPPRAPLTGRGADAREEALDTTSPLHRPLTHGRRRRPTPARGHPDRKTRASLP